MKFRDSSALVPLVIEEPNSRECRDLVRADPTVAVWQFTRTEVASAILKGARAAPVFPADEVTGALERLADLAKNWHEVMPLTRAEVVAIRDRAQALMVKHTLYAADALQLAAAMERFDPPMKRDFVVSDALLAKAAEKEGFNVIRLTPVKRRRGR